MLVLSRKLNEGLTIGDDVTIKIVSIEKGNVKIGIEAPKSKTILRSELIEAVTDANKQATTAIDDGIFSQLHTKLNK